MKTQTNMHVAFPPMSKCSLGVAFVLVLLVVTLADAQLTPSDDAYVNSAAPTTNYGAATTLGLSSAADTAFIRFDLTAVPPGDTGASIAKATLKLYVNSVTTTGSFNVDYVTGTWAEQTIKYNLQPAIGTTIAASVPLATASKGKYVEIDVTAALVEWLNGTQANDGIALVANSPLVATFDSKENTSASHPPELDVVYAGIAGITTASGSGLTGGGSSGTLNLSLLTSCATKQVLQWNGTAWACGSTGTGTITGVTAGTDLTGGGKSGTVTLNLDTTKVPQLLAANTFTGNQTINGNLTDNGTINASGSISSTNGSMSALYGSFSANGNSDGVDAIASAVNFTGVFGFATATSGTSTGAEGVSVSDAGYGVYGINGASSGYGTGVYGLNNFPSSTGSTARHSTGVWGDSGLPGNLGWGVLATSDDSTAVVAINNTINSPTADFENFETTFPLGPVLYAGAGSFGFGASNCTIYTNGDLACTGSKSAVVPVDNGTRKVALYAIEGPENWFEDAGSGHLVNGAATITLEPIFAQTINTNLDYHVFLTPKGDCKGLYVSNEVASSFEVHELGGGTSTLDFDYRIMAKRKGYENVRLADMTRLELHHSVQRRPIGSTAAPAKSGQSPAKRVAAPIQPAVQRVAK